MFTLADVAAFLGVPMPGLTQPMVDAAVVSVRRYCRWHIAPPVTETVRANVDGCTIRLPSLHVTDVATVTAVDAGSAVSGWRWSAEGSISGSFPQGFRTVDVEFTHGYPVAEVADVLAVVVSICRRVAAGGLAASGGSTGPIAEEHIGTYSYRLADTGGTLGSVDLTDTERDMLAQYRLAVIV